MHKAAVSGEDLIHSLPCTTRRPCQPKLHSPSRKPPWAYFSSGKWWLLCEDSRFAGFCHFSKRRTLSCRTCRREACVHMLPVKKYCTRTCVSGTVVIIEELELPAFAIPFSRCPTFRNADKGNCLSGSHPLSDMENCINSMKSEFFLLLLNPRCPPAPWDYILSYSTNNIGSAMSEHYACFLVRKSVFKRFLLWGDEGKRAVILH